MVFFQLGWIIKLSEFKINSNLSPYLYSIFLCSDTNRCNSKADDNKIVYWQDIIKTWVDDDVHCNDLGNLSFYQKFSIDQ